MPSNNGMAASECECSYGPFWYPKSCWFNKSNNVFTNLAIDYGSCSVVYTGLTFNLTTSSAISNIEAKSMINFTIVILRLDLYI